MNLLALVACSTDTAPVFFGAASTEGPATQVFGAEVRTSFASSTLLARQIELGAPADLFLSADPDLADDLGERHDLLGNRLVLAGHGTLDEAPCVAVGDPETVPLGRYTQDAIDLSPHPTLPAESASATARLVRSGQCPLGVLYATDAGDLPVLRELDADVVYPAVVTGEHGDALLATLRANLEPFADAGFTLR